MPSRAPDVLVLFGLLLAGLALAVKALTVSDGGEDAQARSETPLPARLEAVGLTSIRRHALTRDASYVVFVVADSRCRAGLALLPLRRNAEGAGLLGAGTRYHFAGADHPRYPHLRFFTATLRFRLLFRLGLAKGPLPQVFAWRPLEGCRNPDALLRQVHAALGGAADEALQIAAPAVSQSAVPTFRNP